MLLSPAYFLAAPGLAAALMMLPILSFLMVERTISTRAFLDLTVSEIGDEAAVGAGNGAGDVDQVLGGVDLDDLDLQRARSSRCPCGRPCAGRAARARASGARPASPASAACPTRRGGRACRGKLWRFMTPAKPLPLRDALHVDVIAGLERAVGGHGLAGLEALVSLTRISRT